jgi:hypothetical protein
MAKSPRKILILKAVPQTKIKGVAVEVEGEAAEAEVAAGAKAIKKKGSGIASFIRRMMTTAQTITRTRKDLRLSSKKRTTRKRGTIP